MFILMPYTMLNENESFFGDDGGVGISDVSLGGWGLGMVWTLFLHDV